MVPTATMGASGPMYNHMYHRPLMHHHGMGGAPMDSRLPSYNMGLPSRHYNPGMAPPTRYMVNPYSHMPPHQGMGMPPHQPMGPSPHQGMPPPTQGMINEGGGYHHPMVPAPPMPHMYHPQGNPQQVQVCISYINTCVCYI